MLVARELWIGPPGADCPKALRGISLSVGPGEWLAITGPNGSGKSTLGLALAGLVRPRRGTVELDGEVLLPENAATRARVAVIFQELSSQLLQTTVADELSFGSRNLGRSEAEVCRAVETWCERLDLGDELSRDPRTLSAGRQQLVLFAAAMISGPDVLIGDEAGAHLDPDTRARVLEVLRAEVDRGLAVIWVTQEPEERAAADRTLALEGPWAEFGGESSRPEFSAEELRTDHAASTATAIEHRDDPTPTRLELIVSPRDGVPGPGILTDRALGIEIGERGVWSLEGRNGSGKTVLLEGAAGLRRLAQLKVSWRHEMKHPPILASQSPELQQFEERVANEVTYAAIKRGLDPREALEIARADFDSLGFSGRQFLERRCWDLSAGERRLMHVVAALVAPASLVLLDEPTCGLDRTRRLALAELVRSRSRRDPVVVATQDSEWIVSLDARRFILRNQSSTSWQVPAKKTD